MGGSVPGDRAPIKAMRVLVQSRPLLALAAQALRHAWGAHAARAQIETLARQHAIAGTDADAVAAHFRQWSAADRFAAQSGALFAALAQQPDARLRRLDRLELVRPRHLLVAGVEEDKVADQVEQPHSIAQLGKRPVEQRPGAGAGSIHRSDGNLAGEAKARKGPR